jgi:hypothetical protein
MPVDTSVVVHTARRPKCHTFMLFHAPTIRQRISHIQAAAQLIYDACRSPLSTEYGSAGISKIFNEGIRTAFEDMLTCSSSSELGGGITEAPFEQQHMSGALVDARRYELQKFVMGVVCLAVQDSQFELALARKAHEAMLQRVQAATAILELRKGALNKLPICVFAKSLYPDWTSGSFWLNKRTAEVLGIDTNMYPDQMVPFENLVEHLSHPATSSCATSHIAFSIGNQRSHACHYTVYIRADGSYVAGMHSNHYLFGPAPSHRLYFSYTFFQPLPVQPSDIDAWARRVMIKHPKERGDHELGWTPAGTSAKYPGIMHQLLQDHIDMHPEDAAALPPSPNTDSTMFVVKT